MPRLNKFTVADGVTTVIGGDEFRPLMRSTQQNIKVTGAAEVSYKYNESDSYTLLAAVTNEEAVFSLIEPHSLSIKGSGGTADIEIGAARSTT